MTQQPLSSGPAESRSYDIRGRRDISQREGVTYSPLRPNHVASHTTGGQQVQIGSPPQNNSSFIGQSHASASYEAKPDMGAGVRRDPSGSRQHSRSPLRNPASASKSPYKRASAERQGNARSGKGSPLRRKSGSRSPIRIVQMENVPTHPSSFQGVGDTVSPARSRFEEQQARMK